jgi:hypothetical protein
MAISKKDRLKMCSLRKVSLAGEIWRVKRIPCIVCPDIRSVKLGAQNFISAGRSRRHQMKWKLVPVALTPATALIRFAALPEVQRAAQLAMAGKLGASPII